MTTRTTQRRGKTTTAPVSGQPIIPPKGTPEEAIAMLRSWLEGDDADLEEQRRTGALLMQALEERYARSAKRFE